MSVEPYLLISGVVLYGLASVFAIVSLVRSGEKWTRAETAVTILGAGRLTLIADSMHNFVSAGSGP